MVSIRGVDLVVLMPMCCPRLVNADGVAPVALFRCALGCRVGSFGEVLMSSPLSTNVSYTFAEPELASLERLFLRTRKALILGQGCGTRFNQLISPLWDDRGSGSPFHSCRLPPQ